MESVDPPIAIESDILFNLAQRIETEHIKVTRAIAQCLMLLLLWLPFTVTISTVLREDR